MLRPLFGSLSFVAALLAPLALSWAQTVPSNFQQTTYKSGMSQITGMAWAKDGADDLLFVSQKSGQIRVIKNGNLQSANVATVSVTTNNEAGLDNIIADPNYSSNKFIYVFACQDIGGGQYRHRIYRFTIANGATVGISAGPTQIGPQSPCMNVNHNGGGMAIGTDNHLYWGTGNLGNGNNTGGYLTGSEWTSLGSKIIRVNLASPNTPPADNPWIGMADPNIKWAFARGFRNPFGLRMRPGTNQLWLTEVGDNYEQIYIVTSGSNQGWVNSGGTGNGGHNENNTNTGNGLLVRVLSYETNNSTYGGCITRGAFYTGSMFPSGPGPAGFSNSFFFCDYNSGKLMRAVLNSDNNGFASHGVFVEGNSSLTDVNTGPDGALYYSSHGGTIYRLAYTGTTAQSIVASTGAITVTEGAGGSFQVRLSAAPSGNVTVNAARSAGSTDVTVTAGATLTFTTANWMTNQTVTVAATEDADTSNESATITLSSTGLTSVNVTVNVTDNDTAAGVPVVTLTAPVNGATVSGTNAEFYGSATTGGTLDRAEFYVDDVLRYTDPFEAATGHFHYNSSHVAWNTTALSNGSHTLMMKVFDTAGLSASKTVTVTVNNSSGSSGLQGDYYTDMNLTNFAMSRVDPGLNFTWGLGSPDTLIPANGFSVRWTGTVIPAFSETYTFYVRSDDGSRLWVNGTLLFDHWVNQGSTEWSGTIALTAGVPAGIVFEYFENGGDALAQFSWSSASQAKGIIPSSAMGTEVLTGGPAGGVGGGGGGGGGGSGGSGGGCGLTGFEGFLILALAGGLRARRR